MSLTSASILVGGTSAATGGTATTFLTKRSSANEHTLILDDGSNFIDQEILVCTTRDPKVNSGSPNGYTQKRSAMHYKQPLLLDNGEYTVNSVRIEVSVDHETTDTEIEALLQIAAQLLHDADFSDFWKKQSLA